MRYCTIFCLSLFLLLRSLPVLADEGMWPPVLLEKIFPEMSRMGLKLTKEQLFDINHASMKDAIVMLDHGRCTGEIISSSGLLLTNHHCGYGNIQKHSSVEHDYLSDGFWAESYDEEMANLGKTASFLISIEDVTHKILQLCATDTSSISVKSKLRKCIANIEDEAKKGTHYEVEIASMFNGNVYYLFVYETFTDIRLVGAPPSSIGKFGGNTDNWMWPRHTGDFSLFRVYSGPDGKPAPYSKENIPLKPRHFLPVSLKGIKEQDFVMVWGYPGTTQRYLTSFGVDFQLHNKHPEIDTILGKVLEIMEEDMLASDAVRIKYATKFAGAGNTWKYYQGQTKGLTKLNVIDKKKKEEEEFRKWYTGEDLSSEYSWVLDTIKNTYNQLTKLKAEQAYTDLKYALKYTEILTIAGQMENLLTGSGKGKDTSSVSDRLDKYYKELDAHFKDYDSALDRKLMTSLFTILYHRIPKEYYPPFFSTYQGNFEPLIDSLFRFSVFRDKETLLAALNKPNRGFLLYDPAFVTFKELKNAMTNIYSSKKKYDKTLQIAREQLLKGYLAMSESPLYPDANSTMRCTYGKVTSYSANGDELPLQTYLSGVMKKENPNDQEFIVPDKLKQLFQQKDFGQYSENGNIPVCFLTNNDITGGNSGSPVINGNGELIGCAFDGNWEAMSSDIAFEPLLQRTIVCDIRYILFIIDKYAGAHRLIDEMKIVNSKN